MAGGIGSSSSGRSNASRSTISKVASVALARGVVHPLRDGGRLAPGARAADDDGDLGHGRQRSAEVA
jgi:hypothetical protein